MVLHRAHRQILSPERGTAGRADGGQPVAQHKGL